eukprot:g6117.t1
MTTSVLDDLGEEVTGILAPVTLCMALTVALVKVLNPSGDSDSQNIVVATAYYDEKEDDSNSEKFSGSILNAIIFVGFIAVLTFILFLLFKYRCVKFIYVYMGFALLDLFFFLTGAVVIKLMRETDLHVDAISLCFILFNFSVVGTMGLFFWKVPIVVKQGYLIVTGVIIAYLFTSIPEWTTWTLLVFMSVYDLAAVLLPGGPLKVLLELAQERNEDIPALFYEVRPSQGQSGNWRDRYRRRQITTATTSQYQSGCISASLAAITLTNEEENPSDPAITEEVALMSPAAGQNRAASSSSSSANPGQSSSRRRESQGDHHRVSFEVDADHREQETDSRELVLPDSLKLGLGDFIFYSVLVGRAAFYDFMTVFAAYFGIIAGLCLTLLLLALYQQALPALPISIVLGLVFYFLTRLVLEPFILPLVLSLTFI